MDARRANRSINKQNEFSELKKEYISNRSKITDDEILVKVLSFGSNYYDVNTRTKNSRVTSRNANPLFLLLRILMNIILIKQQWIVLCLSFTLVSAYKEQKFAIEPQDQSAVIGSRVTLPCRVESKAGQLQWTKDDFGLGTHRQLSGYERYKMIGSDEEGDYSLDIREVTLDDDALYQCQVSTGSKGEPAIRSRYARLTVLVPPEPPKIKPGPILQAVEDREVSVECYSVGGKPAAEITWVDNEGGVLSQGVTYTVEQMPDGRRFNAKSVLHLRPRRQHHNQTFTCQAQNTADRTYKATTVKLQVQYAPRVKVYVKSGASSGRIREGEVLILGCQASANPNNLTYKWFINNEEIINVNYNELVLSNVSRRHNEATVKCEVHNAVGNSADTKTLEVAFPPTFKSKPQNVEGDPGTTVTLSCLVQGHPPPKIVWLRYENERIIRVGRTSNLSVTVTKQSAGQYWCRASADGFKDIESLAIIYVKGPPKIISNQTQNGLKGDSVRVECISFSVPKPEYVSWTFEGKEINTYHDQEYTFLDETLPDKLTKSTLIIHESQSRHFGVYNCTVTNAYGSDSLEINLLPDKSLPFTIIMASGASTLIFFVIIVFIITICYRKSNKSDVKKPDITDVGKTCVDQFKDSDRSSNISDLKLELRQVEGSCDMDQSNTGSESELRSTLHLTTNLGLPLAGPVPLPESGYDNELMKQYQRYSGDFNQPINNMHMKNQGQNGYVPYVDYSRDYAPPQSTDALTGSLSRSTDISSYPSHYGSLHRQTSCGRLGGMIGPDVIPMANSGVMFTGGVDVRYAATYGNPYLRGSGSLPYGPQTNVAHQSQSLKPAPPPYYSVRTSNIPPLVTSITPSSSSSSSRPVTSPLGSSSTNSGAQPQVPNPPQNPGAHYILPPSSQGNFLASQITARGNGSLLKAGTHV